MSSFFWISYFVLWLLFVLTAIMLISVMRNLGVIYESLAAKSQQQGVSETKLTPGQKLPDVVLLHRNGLKMPLSRSLTGKTAVSIISPTCSPCRELLQEVAQGTWQADPLDPNVQNTVVISVGDAMLTSHLVREVELDTTTHVFFDTERSVMTLWGVSATPTTIILDEEQKVVRHVIGLGGERLQNLASATS